MAQRHDAFSGSRACQATLFPLKSRFALMFDATLEMPIDECLVGNVHTVRSILEVFQASGSMRIVMDSLSFLA